jgi:hypothetical protein
MRIDLFDQVARVVVVRPDDLGDRAGGEMRVAGVFAFGREAEEEIDTRAQARAFQDRLDDGGGGTGPDRAFQHDQLSGPEPFGDAFDGGDDVFQFGFAGVGQRRRHADQDHVLVCEAREIGGRGEFAGGDGSADAVLGEIADDALARIDAADAVGVDVEAGGRKARLGNRERKRQADIAEAERCHCGLTAFNAVLQGGIMGKHAVHKSTPDNRSPHGVVG